MDFIRQAFTGLGLNSFHHIRQALAILGPLSVLVLWYGLKPYGESVIRAKARV